MYFIDGFDVILLQTARTQIEITKKVKKYKNLKFCYKYKKIIIHRGFLRNFKGSKTLINRGLLKKLCDTIWL